MPQFGSYPVVGAPRSSDTVLVLHGGSVKQTKLSADSVAAVRLLSVSNIATGAVIHVLGYAEPGDGGEGQYIYDADSSETDNGGLVIAPASGSGRWIRTYSDRINVKWFGARGDDNISGPEGTDDTNAIQAALDAIGLLNGGSLYFPTGTYLIKAELSVSRYTELIGDGGKGDSQDAEALGATRIHGKHSGNSIVNLVGINGCKLTNIGVYGDPITPPVCGVLMGRASNLGSAGHHQFSDVVVSGHYRACAVASISSENNIWNASIVSLLGGGAKIAFFTSQSPNLPFGAITSVAAYGGTNLNHVYQSLTVLNYVVDANAVGFYDDVGNISGTHSFFGCWSAMKSGSHVYIRVGTVNDSNCPGTLTFIGWNGESLNGGSATAGFKIDNGGNAWSLSGLTIIGSRLTLPAGANFLLGNATLVLKDSFIDVPTTTVGSSFTSTGWINVHMNLGTGSGYSPRFLGPQLIEGRLTVENIISMFGVDNGGLQSSGVISGRAAGGALGFGFNSGADVGRYSALGLIDNNGTFTVYLKSETTGLTFLGAIQEYADNAAAVGAGLPVGRFYRTGDTLKVVHS